MNKIEKKNFLMDLPFSSADEIFESIVERDDIKIERIISEGQATSEGYWFDQDQHEFVLLLKGKAQLSFEDDQPVVLNPGDYIIIPAHKKHRVEWTSKIEKTIWLTVFY